MPSETEVDVKLALQQQITTAVQSSLLSKILITCETSATVIFKYFDQSELLDIGIHRVDKLKSQRSAEEEMMGIYVCVSTPETLATIMADFKSTPAYKEAYFISIGVIPPGFIQILEMSAVHDYLKSWGCCAINLESLEFQQDNVTKANDKLAKVLIEPTVAGSGPIENNNDGMLTAITNLELTPTETIVDQIPAGLIVVNDPYPPREIAKIQPANRYDMSSELLSPDSPGLSIFVVNDDATAPDSVDAIIETSDVLRDPTIQRRQPGTDGLVFAAKFKELANLTLLERDLLGNGVIHLNIAESTDQGVGSYHIPKRMHVPTGVVRLPEEQMRNTSPHYNQPVVPDVINQPFSTNSPTPYQPRPSPSPTFPNATPPNYTNSTHSSGDSYTNNSYGPNGGIPNYPQQRPMLSNQQQQYPMNQFSPQMQPRPNQFVNQNPMPRPQMQQMLVYPQQSRPIMPVRPDYPQRTQFNNQQPFPLGMHPQEQYAQVMGPDGRTFLVPLSQLQFNQNQPPNFVNRPMQGQFPPARQFSQPQFRPAPPNVVVRPQFRPQFQPHYRPNEGQIQPRRN